MQANHWGHKSYQHILPPEKKSFINHSKTVTKTTSNRTCYKEGGNANTAGAIYSTLCTKHGKLCVGQARPSLKERINGHCSDGVHHLDRFNFTQHYNVWTWIRNFKWFLQLTFDNLIVVGRTFWIMSRKCIPSKLCDNDNSFQPLSFPLNIYKF